MPWEERKKALLAFNDALEEEKDGFVKLLTTEQGKPVSLVFLFLLCGVLGCRDEDEITVKYSVLTKDGRLSKLFRNLKLRLLLVEVLLI